MRAAPLSGRQRGATLAGALVLLALDVGVLLVAAVVLLLIGAPATPEEGGACSGGRLGWGLLQLAIAIVGAIAASLGVRAALQARLPLRSFAVALAAAALWLLVFNLIPEGPSNC